MRNKRLGGHKFRRQATVESRILDFFCPQKALAVEIDGQTHDREKDRIRDAALERATGIVTLRFTNTEVMTNMEGVKIALLGALNARADRWEGACATTPQPPPLKRRGL